MTGNAQQKTLTFADLAADLGKRPPRAGGTRVVAVDGPSGSGKTFFAARLAAALDAPTVGLDDLYPGWDGLAEAPGLLVRWLLAPLAQGRPARYRRFDWERREYAEWRSVPAADTLVIEGVGSGARVCAPYLSFLVWIEAPEPLRMRRGIERDGEVFRPYWERWAVQERRMFAAERTRERADLLVDGSAEDASGCGFVLLEG
ncbi:AAA domain [Rubrobacter radiotolerans]|uniref:AAA domain n=1 Tax=Rubrobacter radiotolerans TaxID=42256 RepID=A0A023WZB3_RUBRA|nr:hypothetical protein [Rubrobacter radiotolerans]AHY45433.1 AAA domain [Rubrobacter radiotolerans]MDX5892844.1 hypothetical protein [Rubrobacter radiotolerans]SMC02608.1 Uridine kinase [Rubrobacter radiotolerans DSM 5868]